MARLIKIVDNKYVQIEEYRNPNICFNTNEYSDSEDYCTLRETFDPFKIFYENLELKKQQKEFIKYLEDYQDGASKSLDSYDCGINDCLEDVLSKYTKIIGFGQYTEK